MEPIELLRRLLDERGVEWWNQTDPEPQTVTMARLGDQLIEYHENANGTTGYHVWNMHDLTPEQAVEATLGRGECHDIGDPSDFCCSECGARMFTDTGETYTMIDSLGNIIEQPNFCPNCGRRIKED